MAASLFNIYDALEIQRQLIIDCLEKSSIFQPQQKSKFDRLKRESMNKGAKKPLFLYHKMLHGFLLNSYYSH